MTETHRIFADKGEWVRCENGHQVCRAARTILYGEVQSPTVDWEDWQQPMPAIGAPADKVSCSICGAKWFNGNGGFHFADGWRTE